MKSELSLHHPMVVQRAQMGDVFSDALNALSTAGNKALQTFQTTALADSAKAVLSDQQVQQALVDQGKQNAAQTLANQILNTANSAQAYVQKNQDQIITVAAVGGLALLALYIVMRRRAA